MGLTSAMTTALTGMQAAETTIDVVGNNVANSNTVGFKESGVRFATQFLQTQSIGSAPSGTRGGTNPRQIGLGSRVAEISPDFTQGTVEISSNPLDVAIQGDGFLVVQGSQFEQLYTRNGQLSINSSDELVTITGQRVLGYAVDDNFNLDRTQLVTLDIPIGSSLVAQATENVTFAGQLNPDPNQLATQPGITVSSVLTDGAIEFPPDLALSDVAPLVPPNAATVAVDPDAGAGSVGAGIYNYKIVYLDGDGNVAAPSVSFGNIETTGTAGVDQAIALTNLPVPTEAYLTQKQIYRTDSTGAGAYYLVDTIAANVTSLIDDAADATITGGTVLDDSSLNLGSYNYYVTFYNEGNGFESRPSGRIGPISISDNGRRVRIEDLPSPTSPDFGHIRIYRNTAGSSEEFYLVDTLVTGTDSFVDSSPDSVISDPTNPNYDTLDLNGPPISLGLPLVEVVSRDGSTYNNLFPVGGGTISFTGAKGGRDLATKELTYDDITTVQQLLEFMDQALGIHNSTSGANPIPGEAGWTLTGDGQIQFTSNYGIENEISIDPSAFQVRPTGAITATSIPLQFDDVQLADGKGATASFVVYDTLGIPLNVSVTTYLEESTGSSFTYRWMANSPQNEPIEDGSIIDTVVGTGTITFNGFGEIVPGGAQTVSISREEAASASPLTFELDFSQVAGLPPAGSTNTGDSSLAAIRQDGFPPGSLSSFIISESGEIRGVFSNGTQRTLGQMVLARFANNAGLKQVGDNLYGVGVNSGLPFISDPGGNGVGTLTAGAVELSNTDIGENLIQLILASTQYRGGARVITAAQELLDELMALRR